MLDGDSALGDYEYFMTCTGPTGTANAYLKHTVATTPPIDPPIDPELLIRAKAAGLSIEDTLSDMYAPPPLYRFNVVVQKAIDLCNEVKALGGAMLSAIEKKEGNAYIKQHSAPTEKICDSFFI